MLSLESYVPAHIPQFGETLFSIVGTLDLVHMLPILLILTEQQKQVMQIYVLHTRIFGARVSCKTGNTCIRSYAKKNASPSCGMWVPETSLLFASHADQR
jgi:hypothetical protein